MEGPAVLHHDEHLLAINKPSGLAVHPGWVSRREPTALKWAREAARQYVYPIHRLDRATSGVLLFGLSPESARFFGTRLSECKKRYVALVRGTPPEHIQVDHAIPSREGGPRVPAQTEVRLLARSEHDRCSLVEALPKTGRLHQIRRHLKHLSHPLIGDVRYGKGDINRHYRAQWGLHRLALHAVELTVPHPSGRVLTIYAAPPRDLNAPLRALGVADAIAESTSQRPPLRATVLHVSHKD